MRNPDRRYLFKFDGAPSIRLTLSFLVIACILPVTVVAAVLIFSFYNHEQLALSRSAIIQARGVISIVDRDISATQSALFALGTSKQLADGNLAGFHERAVLALNNINAASILLMDADGKILLSTLKPFGELLGQTTNPALLNRVLSTGRAGVSDIFVGAVSHRFIFSTAVPIKRDGVIVYLLVAAVTPDLLKNLLADQRFPETWRSVITDSTGSIATRSHELARFAGKKVVPGLLRQMDVANEGSFESITLEGIPVLTAYSRSPTTKWMAGLAIPLKELTFGLRKTFVNRRRIGAISSSA